MRQMIGDVAQLPIKKVKYWREQYREEQAAAMSRDFRIYEEETRYLAEGEGIS